MDPERQVGFETKKTYAAKLADGFIAKYLSGDSIIEVGFAGHDGATVPIVPNAIGIDQSYPGYDGINLPFPTGSQDAVYSSHCLEHIADYRQALVEWFRVVKVGGYLIIAIPHQFLFERKTRLPSRWNIDHKHMFTSASILADIETLFAPNAYRVRQLLENDKDFDYDILPDEGGVGCYEIELVIQKIGPPKWELDDGSARLYAPREFSVRARGDTWWIETTFAETDGCWIWGPYVPLHRGRYRASFLLEPRGMGETLEAPVQLDVASNYGAVCGQVTLDGEQGAHALSTCSVAIDFVAETGALHEFRVSYARRPFAGSLRFFGVSLRYLGL